MQICSADYFFREPQSYITNTVDSDLWVLLRNLFPGFVAKKIIFFSKPLWDVAIELWNTKSKILHFRYPQQWSITKLITWYEENNTKNYYTTKDGKILGKHLLDGQNQLLS